MPSANQHDIAQTLNLSQPTVSRSLANHPAINAETKALVWETAIRLGYKQKLSLVSKNGKSGKPMIIGIIVSIPQRFQSKTETFQLALRGISEKSSSEKIILDVLHHEPDDARSNKSLLKRIRLAGWQGCVMIHPMPWDLVSSIEKMVSCVSIVENYRNSYIDCVDVDQTEAIFSLVKALVDAGHRKIGYYSWVYQVPTPWVQHRLGSFVEAMYRCGLEFDASCCVNIHPDDDLTPGQAAEAAAKHIRNGTTAYVCAADHQAYELIHALKTEHNISVPTDCSITGFDGIDAPVGLGQVATTRVPYDELGRSAVNQLLRRMEQPTAPRRHLLVDGEMVEGSTIAPIRASSKTKKSAKKN